VTDANCLFCKIVAGEIPSDTVHEDELVLAFNDINPMAPVHQLVIPKRHIASAAELTESEGELLGRLFAVTAELAVKAGVAESGYRVVTNVGADGGQSVDHMHLHLLGGRSLTWPPG
jgi:histidine triad (HIT) family protein